MTQRREVAHRMKQLLWTRDGRRRIPSVPAFDEAARRLPTGELERICEFDWDPIYLVPTRPFLTALARTIRKLGVRDVLEVAAGDGHLGRSLQRTAKDLRVRMSDSGGWEKPQARMNAEEKRVGTNAHGLRLGADVERLEATRAIRKHRPELVLASWLPPGPMLAKLIRSDVRYVVEIGAGSGVTGDIGCWRFDHEFLEGAIERSARCRLDERPGERLHTRVTLYYARAHEEFYEERR